MASKTGDQPMQELLDRVKAATGPDARIDVDIATVVGWKWNTIEGSLGYWTNPDGDQMGIPDVTASVDAILSMIERELPGWGYSFQRPRTGWERKPGVHGFATIGGGDPLVAFHADGATTALALCAAFLASLQKQESGE